jgi:hypothetical protein
MADLNITVVVLRPPSAAQGVVAATADQGRAGAVLLRQPSAGRGPGQAGGQEDPAKEEARAPDSARAEAQVPAADPAVAVAVAAEGLGPEAAGGPGPEAVDPAALGAVAGTPATGKQA